MEPIACTAKLKTVRSGLEELATLLKREAELLRKIAAELEPERAEATKLADWFEEQNQLMHQECGNLSTFELRTKGRNWAAHFGSIHRLVDTYFANSKYEQQRRENEVHIYNCAVALCEKFDNYDNTSREQSPKALVFICSVLRALAGLALATVIVIGLGLLELSLRSSTSANVPNDLIHQAQRLIYPIICTFLFLWCGTYGLPAKQNKWNLVGLLIVGAVVSVPLFSVLSYPCDNSAAATCGQIFVMPWGSLIATIGTALAFIAHYFRGARNK